MFGILFYYIKNIYILKQYNSISDVFEGKRMRMPNLACLTVITFIAMILIPMVAAQTIEESAIALRAANGQYLCAEGGGWRWSRG